MRVARILETALLAVYLIVGFAGLVLLSGNSYEWMLSEPGLRGDPASLCDLPRGDSPRDVGLVFAIAMTGAGLAAGALLYRRRRSRLFLVGALLVAIFAAYRLYLREAACG